MNNIFTQRYIVHLENRGLSNHIKERIIEKTLINKLIELNSWNQNNLFLSYLKYIRLWTTNRNQSNFIFIYPITINLINVLNRQFVSKSFASLTYIESNNLVLYYQTSQISQNETAMLNLLLYNIVHTNLYQNCRTL